MSGAPLRPAVVVGPEKFHRNLGDEIVCPIAVSLGISEARPGEIGLWPNTEVGSTLQHGGRVIRAEEELVNLTPCVAAINAWNRLSIALRAPAGTYQPPAKPKKASTQTSA